MRQVDDVVELIWESLAGDGRAEGAADAGAAGAADHLPVWLAASSVSRSGRDPRSRSRLAARRPDPRPTADRAGAPFGRRPPAP